MEETAKQTLPNFRWPDRRVSSPPRRQSCRPCCSAATPKILQHLVGLSLWSITETLWNFARRSMRGSSKFRSTDFVLLFLWVLHAFDSAPAIVVSLLGPLFWSFLCAFSFPLLLVLFLSRIAVGCCLAVSRSLCPVSCHHACFHSCLGFACLTVGWCVGLVEACLPSCAPWPCLVLDAAFVFWCFVPVVRPFLAPFLSPSSLLLVSFLSPSCASYLLLCYWVLQPPSHCCGRSSPWFALLRSGLVSFQVSLLVFLCLPSCLPFCVSSSLPFCVPILSICFPSCLPAVFRFLSPLLFFLSPLLSPLLSPAWDWERRRRQQQQQRSGKSTPTRKSPTESLETGWQQQARAPKCRNHQSGSDKPGRKTMWEISNRPIWFRPSSEERCFKFCTRNNMQQTDWGLPWYDFNYE